MPATDWWRDAGTAPDRLVLARQHTVMVTVASP